MRRQTSWFGLAGTWLLLGLLVATATAQDVEFRTGNLTTARHAKPTPHAGRRDTLPVFLSGSCTVKAYIPKDSTTVGFTSVLDHDALRFRVKWNSSNLDVEDDVRIFDDGTIFTTVYLPDRPDDASWPSLRLEFVSDAFLQVGEVDGPFVYSGDSSVAPVSVTVAGNTLTYTRDEPTATPVDFEVDYLLLGKEAPPDCEVGSGPCCDDKGKFKDMTIQCRDPGACHKRTWCSGESADCPASPKPNGAHCAWRPFHKRPDAYPDSAPPAAGVAASKPAYSECEGVCEEGHCSLRGHPECCFVHPDHHDDDDHSDYGKDRDYYADDAARPYTTTTTTTTDNTKATTSREVGFWRAHDLFCWKPEGGY